MRRLAPSPLAAWPWGPWTRYYGVSQQRRLAEKIPGRYFGCNQATAERHPLPGRRKHKNKTWSRRDTKGVVLFSLGIRGERSQEPLSHGILGPPAAFSGFTLARIAYKAGWTTSSTFLANLLAHYSRAPLKLSANCEEGPALLSPSRKVDAASIPAH
ncbi:hypothetical protein TESG_08428 [Trichophyton tonsurans CBS 112818]|uniref:Uncharacterized protein n=2 Tax=Trichophyton TaxID=5550 RepID=F2PZG8_TRIEC|nr:hypothetical protein TESG_08428 [Trichophyton tonsurans CBS 112818]EGE07286.1 hypothetical protein TEQG_06195 [Trichophyton equinum CBS 127.97]